MPGIEPSEDKLLQGRLFSYPDTQRYRVGPNYQQLTVNAPRVEVHTTIQDGPMSFLLRSGDTNYEPSALAPRAATTPAVPASGQGVRRPSGRAREGPVTAVRSPRSIGASGAPAPCRRSRAVWLVTAGLALALGACANKSTKDDSGGGSGGGRTLTQTEAGRYLLDAARAGDSAVVEGLLAKGAPVEARDDKGYSPLILAAYRGHAATVETLLAHGADPCGGDKSGNTALMGAAFKGYDVIVERLSREKCEVDQTNGSGRTALMFAALVGKTRITRLLESKGAARARVDRSGRSADDWATTQGVDLRTAP